MQAAVSSVCVCVCVCRCGTETFPLTTAGEDEEAVDDEDTPQLDTIMIQHEGVINRLRVRDPATWLLI